MTETLSFHKNQVKLQPLTPVHPHHLITPSNKREKDNYRNFRSISTKCTEQSILKRLMRHSVIVAVTKKLSSPLTMFNQFIEQVQVVDLYLLGPRLGTIRPRFRIQELGSMRCEEGNDDTRKTGVDCRRDFMSVKTVVSC